MTDPVPGKDAPAQRGRLEMRTILLIVAAVIVLGAIVSILFGAQGEGRVGVDSPGPAPRITDG